jgi:hypothetical protein
MKKMINFRAIKIAVEKRGIRCVISIANLGTTLLAIVSKEFAAFQFAGLYKMREKR